MPGDEIVTLRLPAAKGPALRELVAEFGRQLAADVRVVVVIATDPERFASASSEDAGISGEISGEHALGWLQRRDLVSVAVLTGEVSGLGLQVALACDLRLAADDAVISFELGADISPQALGDITARLADLVGYSRALELLIGRRRLSGRDAGRLGLVNQAVPTVHLEATVDELVAALVSTPGEAAAEIKTFLAGWQDDRHARFADVATAVSLARGQV